MLRKRIGALALAACTQSSVREVWYPPPGAKEHARRGEPHHAFAKAVSPHIAFNVNLATKAVEYYDEERRIWHPQGGEVLLAGESLHRILNELFGKVVLKVQHDDEKCKEPRLCARVRVGGGPLACHE